ncbi:MAG: HesA/MoeB/ThiF family protein [Bacteroidales bacterium]|nr:HesA/MoeB/ThiF family protein [Bacteroidales bacterium]
MNLNEEQIERYSRHILLSDVGLEGQEKIIKSSVLIIGAGGLGAPVAFYLAAAGVGTIGIIDGDVVDRTNLQRQILHFTPDIGKAKVISAKEKIEQLNPEIRVNAYQDLVSASNIRDYISEYDFIIDGTDNFPTKFLINDACVLEKKPFSHGGILRFSGQTMTYTPGNTCYRCVFNSPPLPNAVPSCSQAGVLGAIAGMLGTIQAAEALKYLTGVGDLLTNKLYYFDALKNDYRTINLNKSDNCAVCGTRPTITELQDIELPACDLH